MLADGSIEHVTAAPTRERALRAMQARCAASAAVPLARWPAMQPRRWLQNLLSCRRPQLQALALAGADVTGTLTACEAQPDELS